ncbi:MAG: hypothetical protein ACOX6K_10410 [Sphaerochaetaceae bacterium]|jgi:putative aldouronate transport system substrate-binding protein
MKGKGRAIGILLALCTVSVALFAGGAKEPVVDQAGSAAFNATGLPIVDDQVVLRFTGMNMNNTRVGRYDETDMMKQLESETNVKIVWDMIPQANWKERKNLLIAVGNFPMDSWGR